MLCYKQFKRGRCWCQRKGANRLSPNTGYLGITSQNLEEKHFLRLQLENIVEDLWRRFQDALKNYTDATEDRKIAFETLKVKDEKSSKEIEAQMKKIQKLQVSAAHLGDSLL